MQGFTEDTPRASDLVQGKSKLSVAPVDFYNPIAVGDNDPRLYVILTYSDFASLPVTGTMNVIYITEDTNFLYRWDGLIYIQIGGGGGGGGHTIKNNGTSFTQRANLDFKGSLVVEDDSGNDATIVRSSGADIFNYNNFG